MAGQAYRRVDDTPQRFLVCLVCGRPSRASVHDGTHRNRVDSLGDVLMNRIVGKARKRVGGGTNVDFGLLLGAKPKHPLGNALEIFQRRLCVLVCHQEVGVLEPSGTETMPLPAGSAARGMCLSLVRAHRMRTWLFVITWRRRLRRGCHGSVPELRRDPCPWFVAAGLCHNWAYPKGSSDRPSRSRRNCSKIRW